MRKFNFFAMAWPLSLPDLSFCYNASGIIRPVLRLVVDRTRGLTHSLRNLDNDSKLTMNTRLLTLPVMLLMTAPAIAQETRSPLSPLFDCRQITSDTARLACLDAAVDRLHESENSGEVVAVNRGDIEAAEEATYGLDISGLRLPGLLDFSLSGGESVDLANAASPGGDAEAASGDYSVERNDDGEITRIVGLAVQDLRRDGYNRLVVTLQNGQTWRQFDDTRIILPRRQPPSEMTVSIRSGALGSHLMDINDRGRWFRVRREE